MSDHGYDVTIIRCAECEYLGTSEDEGWGYSKEHDEHYCPGCKDEMEGGE